MKNLFLIILFILLLCLSGCSAISPTNESSTDADADTVFTDSLVIPFDETMSEEFNYYTIAYSSSCCLKGELTYITDGQTYIEEFFLESGDDLLFQSFCDNALTSGINTSVLSLKFFPLGSTQATFSLNDFSVRLRNIETTEVIYLTNDHYKLGINLIWGGAISYLEDLQDEAPSITNLLNNHDTGRLIQQSYYGTDSFPYVPSDYNGNTWRYNPVQGGDRYNHHSKLIDFHVSPDGHCLYVKCRPLDWAKDNSLTPSYMENTYTLEENYIQVDNRFIDFSGYTHQTAHQELPAFYTISYLSEFVYYGGAHAWSGDTLTTKTDLPFWAGNPDSYFKLNSRETWGAWVSPEHYGIGVYTPIADTLLSGRYQYNGSTDSSEDATNYLAPLITYRLKAFRPFTYSYYITTGNLEEIRGTFYSLKEPTEK